MMSGLMLHHKRSSCSPIILKVLNHKKRIRTSSTRISTPDTKDTRYRIEVELRIFRFESS